MADPNSTDFDDEAYYINPGRIYLKNREYRLLAAFGPTAPSFINAQGSAFKITAPTEVDTAASEVEVDGKKKRAMEVLIMTMKPIEVAFEDWKLTLKEPAVRVNQLERAVPSRTYVYRHDERDQLWTRMRETIGQAAYERIEGAAAKKRKRGADEDEESSKRKGKAKATGESFDLFSF